MPEGGCLGDEVSHGSGRDLRSPSMHRAVRSKPHHVPANLGGLLDRLGKVASFCP